MKVKIKNKLYTVDQNHNVYTAKGTKSTKMQTRVINKLHSIRAQDPIKMKASDFEEFILSQTSEEKTQLFNKLYRNYLYINSQNMNTLLMTKKMSKIEQKLYMIINS